MRILVACEYSARVRDAFRERGHDAWSCDLLPTDGDPAYHYQGDVLDVLTHGWDCLIGFPPCTDLSLSGARYWADKVADGRQGAALEFVRALLDAPIEHIAIENPVGVISSAIRKPDQVFHPWQFGHGEKKRTCLWLKNLPKLTPTEVVEGRESRIHHLPPSDDRAKLRSLTYLGVARAMAGQWGAYLDSFSLEVAA